MKKKILSALVSLALALALTAAAGTPASAAATQWIGPCHGVSIICLAEHQNGGGLHWRTSLPYGVCVNVPSWLDNKTDSLWNKYGWDSSSPPLPLNGYGGQNCASDFMYQWGPSAYVLYIGFINRNRMSSVCIGPRQSGYCR